MDFLDQFDRDFAPRLGHRAETFRAVFAALANRVGAISIVETGCARDPGNWAGDGQSTFLFDRFVAWKGGSVIAIDINPVSVAAARSMVGERTQVIEADSVATLPAFRPMHVDLLYLDSLDFDGNNPLVSATHHLFELTAAMPLLGKGSLVMVDDTSERQGELFGKGLLVAKFMTAAGVPIFAKGETQVAWML